jgi:tellurite methyltransferase
MPNTPFWETTYQDFAVSSFGKPSQEFYDLIHRLPPHAKVLDLGCGEGRNALFLAEHGCEVTAVDISVSGIQKLQHLAASRALSIQTAVQDMRTYTFQECFDLIISHGCLHLIARDEWQPLLAQCQHYTKLGGYNIVVVFTDRIVPSEDMAEFCVGLFREGELFEYYAKWITHRQESYALEHEHPGNIRHTHAINKIVAQKPH